MLRIKRLYLFMLQSFLPLFLMTFLICLFIVLMQFLWKNIDDLVGKGLEISVIGELFFYAALSMAPMALPLAVLLASLMTFGNLGERFELTAMKASGVSLIKSHATAYHIHGPRCDRRILLPEQRAPHIADQNVHAAILDEAEIARVGDSRRSFLRPDSRFQPLCPRKERDAEMLYDVLIYNVSKGSDNATIIYSDSEK